MFSRQTNQWKISMDKKYHYLLYLWFLFIDISPHQCSRAYGLFRQRSKSITDKADATDFIFSRISFTLGFVTDFFAPDGAGLPQAKGKSVRIHAPMAHIIQMHQIKIRERTDPSHQCYPCPLWTLVVVAKRWAHDDMSGTVFQTAIYTSVVIPRLRPGLLSLRSV